MDCFEDVSHAALANEVRNDVIAQSQLMSTIADLSSLILGQRSLLDQNGTKQSVLNLDGNRLRFRSATKSKQPDAVLPLSVCDQTARYC